MLQFLPFHVQAANSQLCVVSAHAQADKYLTSVRLLVQTGTEAGLSQKLWDVCCRKHVSKQSPHRAPATFCLLCTEEFVFLQATIALLALLDINAGTDLASTVIRVTSTVTQS